MSAFHEWEANQRYNEILRTARRYAEWNLEDGRLPRKPGFWTRLARLFRGRDGEPGDVTQTAAEAPQHHAAAATKPASTPPPRDHPKAS
jgi:hypothetical protein